MKRLLDRAESLAVWKLDVNVMCVFTHVVLFDRACRRPSARHGWGLRRMDRARAQVRADPRARPEAPVRVRAGDHAGGEHSAASTIAGHYLRRHSWAGACLQPACLRELESACLRLQAVSGQPADSPARPCHRSPAAVPRLARVVPQRRRVPFHKLYFHGAPPCLDVRSCARCWPHCADKRPPVRRATSSIVATTASRR